MHKILLALATAALAVGVPAQDPRPAAEAAKPAAPAVAAKTWTSIAAMPATCVVSGRELKADTVQTVEVGGRTFHLCCSKCPAKVESEPAKYAEKLDAAIIAAQAPSYPLAKCPISGKELGDKPTELVLQGQLVRLCCERCAPKAKDSATEIVASIEAASHAQQAKSYPLRTCVVTGEEIGADATEVMYGNTLLRLCCEDCVDEVKKAPAKYLGVLAAAKAPADGKAEKAKGADGKPAGKGSGADGAAAGCCSGEAGGSCCAAKGASGAKSCCEPTTGSKAGAPKTNGQN